MVDNIHQLSLGYYYSRPVGRGRPLALARDSAVSLRFARFLQVLLHVHAFSFVFYSFSESVFLWIVSLDKRLTVPTYLVVLPNTYMCLAGL